MKMFFVLACCLALVGVAHGQNMAETNNPNQPPPKKKATHAEEVSHHAVPPGTSHGIAIPGLHATGHPPPQQQTHHNASTASFRSATAIEKKNRTSASTFQTQHYNLSTKTKPASAAPAVTFRAGNRIQGSQTWQGSHYTAFRSYSPQWHDRNWWGSRFNRIVFVFGGWYYWDANYWYPAWGYDPNAYYSYDGPIYAYNDLPPDQVIANVQAALQAQGYYQGEVDGVLGPLTRAAIANYQRDQGLYITSAIDEPTLASLGMV